jgi:hypothetical protein
MGILSLVLRPITRPQPEVGLITPAVGAKPFLSVFSNTRLSDPTYKLKGANMEEDEIPADKLVKAYIRIRDAKSELVKQHEAELAKLEEQMDVLSKKMLDICKDNGADSIKTNAGTIMRSVSTRYMTNDWDSLYKFIKEHDAIGLLAKFIHQGNMKQFIEENPDVFPPGMLVDSQYKIVVRRSK